MDLHDRLRREMTHDVDPATRDRHLAAAQAAKGLRWTASAEPVRGLRWDARAVTRRIGAGLAVFGLVAVPSAAMAQDALPGETLYPVKLVVEPLQTIFDEDIVARHRADEVAALLEDGDTPSEALERALARAEEALANSNASDNARQRVAEVRERFEQKRAEKAEERAERDAEKAEERAERDAAKAEERAERDAEKDKPTEADDVAPGEESQESGDLPNNGNEAGRPDKGEKGNSGNGQGNAKDKPKGAGNH